MNMISESNARWVKDLEDCIKEHFPRLKLTRFLTGKADLELTVPNESERYRRIKLLMDSFVEDGFLVKTGLDANGIKAWTVQEVGGPNRVAVTRHPSGSQYSIVPIGKSPFPMTNVRQVTEATALASSRVSSKIDLRDFVSQSNEEDQENWVDSVQDDPNFKTDLEKEIEEFANTAYVAGANPIVVEIGGKARVSTIAHFWIGHDVYGFSAAQNPVKPNVYQILKNDRPKEFTPEVLRAVLGAYAKKGKFGQEMRFKYDEENDGGGITLTKDKFYVPSRSDTVLKQVGKPIADKAVAVYGGEKLATEWYTYANGDFKISLARNPADPNSVYVKDVSPALDGQIIMQRWLARNFVVSFDRPQAVRHLKTLKMETTGLGVSHDGTAPRVLAPGEDPRPKRVRMLKVKIPLKLVGITKNAAGPIYHYTSKTFNQDFTVQADPKDKKYGLKFVNQQGKSAVMHFIRAGVAPAHKQLVADKKAKVGAPLNITVLR